MISVHENITLFLEAIIYGFCFTSFTVIFLSFFKSQKLKQLKDNYFRYAIKIIRIVGVIYLVYYIAYTIYMYSAIMTEDDIISTKNRATGVYAWAYWMMSLRPVFICLATQLFWIKKTQTKRALRSFSILLTLILLLLSGANLERFVIIITSLHRDYLPSSFTYDETWWLVIMLIFAFIIERIILFSFLATILWFSYKKNKSALLLDLTKLKSFTLFWIAALLILIIGPIAVFEDSALDINVHDTYYVISHFNVFILLGVIYSFIGFIYWIFHKIGLELNVVLTKIHVILTIGLFLVYQIGVLLFFNDVRVADNFPLLDGQNRLNLFTTAIMISAMIAQLFFIVNLIISIFKDGLRRTTRT